MIYAPVQDKALSRELLNAPFASQVGKLILASVVVTPKLDQLLLTCLTEEEFRAASPPMGMAPEEYQGFKCVVATLRGPDKLAALMSPDAGSPIALSQAAMGCELSMSEGPPG